MSEERIKELDVIEHELRLKRTAIEQEISSVEKEKRRIWKLMPRPSKAAPGTERHITPEGRSIVELAAKHGTPKLVTDIGARLKGSNSHHLFRDHGWRGVLVERDKEQCSKIVDEFGKKEGVTIFCESAIPETMNKYIPESCGVLCIDVDGNDYHLWNAVKAKPQIVVIEIGVKNVPKDSPHIAPYIEGDPKRHNGSNYHAMVELGKKKGYRLHKQIGVNLVFLRE